MNETVVPTPSPSRRIPPRAAAILLMVAVFVVGILAGFALDRAVYRAHHDWRFHGRGGAPIWMIPEVQQRRHWDRISDRLHLTPEQRAAVDSILTRRARQLEDARLRIDPMMRAIMEGTRHQIDSVLTPDQRARLEQLRRERGPRGPRGPEGGPGGPEGPGGPDGGR